MKFINEVYLILWDVFIYSIILQVTILVAAKGAHKLPNNNGSEDLKKALQKLRSILLLPSKLLVSDKKDIKLINVYI